MEFTAGAGNKDAARNVAFAVFHAFYDPGGLAALGAIGALGGVHYFLAVRRFGDLSHGSIVLLKMFGFPRPLKSAAAIAAGNLGTARHRAVRPMTATI